MLEADAITNAIGFTHISKKKEGKYRDRNSLTFEAKIRYLAASKIVTIPIEVTRELGLKLGDGVKVRLQKTHGSEELSCARAILNENKYLRNQLNSCMDIIVLVMLKGNPLHGYKIIAELHKTFGVLFSPGTLYPILYRLKEKKLVELKEYKRRKLYNLTPKGQREVSNIVKLFKENNEKIYHFIDKNLETKTIAI